MYNGIFDRKDALAELKDKFERKPDRPHGEKLLQEIRVHYKRCMAVSEQDFDSCM